MRKLKVLLILVTFALTNTSSVEAVPSIPPTLKKSVASIFVLDGAGKEYTRKGTGFFVGVKDAVKQSFDAYFVTAKHVVQKEDKKSFFPEIFLRLNKKEGEPEFFRLPLIQDGEERNIFLHEQDSSVDLVVISALPNQSKYDFLLLPSSMIAAEKDMSVLKIREGTEVFFLGQFGRYHIGLHTNQPIVRFGKVALVTDEKIIWGGIETDLFLIECTSYEGNSGAPVFYFYHWGAEWPNGGVHAELSTIKLAGIIKGYIQDASPDFAYQNIGISGAIPAQKLHEILFSEELLNKRNAKR